MCVHGRDDSAVILPISMFVWMTESIAQPNWNIIVEITL